MNSTSRSPGRRHAGAAAITAALVFGGGCQIGGGTRPEPPGGANDANAILVTPTAFGELNATQGDVYNASGIVPVGDSQFLIVDNNTNHALIALTLGADGKQAAPLAQRPLVGLADDAVDDVEDIALAEENGRRYVFGTPSLSVKAGSKKKGKEQKVRPAALLRVAIGEDGSLTTDAMPGFRDWFVQHVPLLANNADNDPDFGGLNVEGLAWDPVRHALLFGIRTPVVGHEPVVVPVKVRDLAGPWTEDNLEVLAPIQIHFERSTGDQGVRGMTRGPAGNGFLLTVANATSNDVAPFSLYAWNGGDDGRARRLPVTFADKMKPEGLTVGTVGGRPAIVFVDDAGGFQVLWLDSVSGL